MKMHREVHFHRLELRAVAKQGFAEKEEVQK